MEWAVFRHTTQLLRDALQPLNRATNGLTTSSVAALLAELWFPPLPPGFGAAGDQNFLLHLDSLSHLARPAASDSAPVASPVIEGIEIETTGMDLTIWHQAESAQAPTELTDKSDQLNRVVWFGGSIVVSSK